MQILCEQALNCGGRQQIWAAERQCNAPDCITLYTVSHILVPGALKPMVNTRLRLSPHKHLNALNCFARMRFKLHHEKQPNTARCPGPCCSDEWGGCAASSQALLRSSHLRSCPAAAPTASPAATRRTAWRPASTHMSWQQGPGCPFRRLCAKALDIHVRMHSLAVFSFHQHQQCKYEPTKGDDSLIRYSCSCEVAHLCCHLQLKLR